MQFLILYNAVNVKYHEVNTVNVESNRMLESILESLSEMEYIKSSKIPDIDLYMDQVLTFMNGNLDNVKRHETDKVMTKTMINNYAKNHLLPAPEKKKYSKEHIMVLMFIYYFKNILSIGDIQSILNPLTERYFANDKDLNLEKIYEEVFTLEKGQIEQLKETLTKDYQRAQNTFMEESEKDQEFLQMFSFICMLSYDIYIRKQIIEKMLDEFAEKKNEK